MTSALMATNDRPCAASQSASAALAKPEVVDGLPVSVIFSTPTTATTSYSLEATAMSPARKAAAPEPQAASIFEASMLRSLAQSAMSAPMFSWRLSGPESMLPTHKACTCGRSIWASAIAAMSASPASWRNDFSHCSAMGVCPIPRIAISRMVFRQRIKRILRILHMDIAAGESVRGFHDHFGQGGVGVDVACDLLGGQLEVVRQREFGEQFGHFGADHVRAEYLAVFGVGHNFYPARVIAHA